MIYKGHNQKSIIKSRNKGGKLLAVRILDIILDINHPAAEKYGGYDAIGTINFTYLDDNTPLESPWVNDQVAQPIFSFVKSFPLINEIVLILSTYDKNTYKRRSKSNYYLPNLNIWNHPHHNALPTLQGQKKETSSRDYKDHAEGGISRQVEDGATDIPLGYRGFEEKMHIKPLLPYEGDTIIEGRFGNSIRFGSTNISDNIPNENKNRWSNEGISGEPIIIIKNGQRTQNINNKGWEHTVEDIDFDDSSIYLTSNQQLTDFRDMDGMSYILPPSFTALPSENLT